MKIVLVGGIAILVGVGAGAFVGGARTKAKILEARVQAYQDSIAAAEAAVPDAEQAAPAASGYAADSGVVPMPVEAGKAETGAEPGPAHGEGAATPDAVQREGVPNADAPQDAQPDSGSTLGSGVPVPADPVAPGSEPGSAMPDAGSATRAAEEAGSAGERMDPEASKKLAKIFGAMKPKDAAAVLQEMKDDEVKAILLQINARNAAQILGSFQPAQAAGLSRAVLAGRAGS